MGRLNITVTGETFTDYPLSSVGASAFRLEHDYFIRQSLVIRDAAGGGGNLLVEDTDFVLAGEDTYLSTQVTLAAGEGRNVMLTVQVINAAYQAVPLYFSGKYVTDALEAADFHRVGYASKSANFSVRKDDGIRTFLITTGTGGAGDVTGMLPALDGTNGRIRFLKVDIGTNLAIMDGNAAEKIGVEQTETSFSLFTRGDYIEVEDMSTYWAVVDFYASGSSANGSWFRRADGYQECWIKVDFTDIPVNVAHGSLFKSAEQTWTFPKAFKTATIPVVVSGTMYVAGTGYGGFVGPVGTSFSTNAIYYYNVLGPANANIDISVCMCAKGVWK